VELTSGGKLIGKETGTGFESGKVDTKLKLAAAWMALIAFYIYADFLSLYRPGQIDEVRRGVMGPFDVSQGSLVVASLIVMIPAGMIVLSLLLPGNSESLAKHGPGDRVHARQCQQSCRRGMGLLLLVRDCGDRNHCVHLLHSVEMAS
jgi:hypothetical protein